MSTWHQVMEPEVKAVLSRPGVQTWVAYCPTAAPGDADLYGWVCVEYGAKFQVHRFEKGRWVDSLVEVPGLLVHYIYVKQPYRRSGVATKLLQNVGLSPDSPFSYTCKTGIVSKLLVKYPHARWNPLIARFPKAGKENEDEDAPSRSCRVFTTD